MCQHFTHGVSWIYAIVTGPPSHAAGMHPFTSCVRQQYGSRCVCVVVGGRVFRNFLPHSLHRPGC